jgi:hypothetical protein
MIFWKFLPLRIEAKGFVVEEPASFASAWTTVCSASELRTSIPLHGRSNGFYYMLKSQPLNCTCHACNMNFDPR